MLHSLESPIDLVVLPYGALLMSQLDIEQREMSENTAHHELAVLAGPSRRRGRSPRAEVLLVVLAPLLSGAEGPAETAVRAIRYCCWSEYYHRRVI